MMERESLNATVDWPVAVEGAELIPQIDEFRYVPVDKVFWKNSIRDFTKEDVINMGASLRVHGQIVPIEVKPANAEGMYEGVIGKQRFEGAKHAHIRTVLVRIHKYESEDEVLEAQLAENLHRKELSALEKASAYGKLAELRRKNFGEEATVEGIAMSLEEMTGTKPAAQTVRKYLEVDARIGKHAKTVNLCREGKTASFLKISHLEQVSRLDSDDKQAELLSYTIHEGWTVQRLKKAVDQELGIVKPAPVVARAGSEPAATEPSPVEATQTIICQQCKASLLLIHGEDGTHRLLLKQRKPL